MREARLVSPPRCHLDHRLGQHHRERVVPEQRLAMLDRPCSAMLPRGDPRDVVRVCFRVTATFSGSTNGARPWVVGQLRGYRIR